MSKQYTNKNVYDATIERIDYILDNFPAYYVSFSGGKDSGVLVQLVIKRARLKNKLPVPVMFFDWETCYKETINFVEKIMINNKEVEPYWICLPEIEDNASSLYERYWKCWDDNKKSDWVREMPKHECVINKDNLPEEWKLWYKDSSYKLWIVKRFGDWLANKKNVNKISCMLGLRTDESYGRHMLISAQKNRDKLNHWCYRTKDSGDKTWITLPIYDWEVKDIWLCNYKNNFHYNRTYDKFYLLGKSYLDMRICNAFGESQKRDLNQWHEVEPETWFKLLKRVEGINFGAMYNKTNLSRLQIKKPNNIKWSEYTRLLFNSLPQSVRKNYEYRFKIIFNWFNNYSVKKLGIQKYMFESRKSAVKYAKDNKISVCYVGSWEDLCGFILKRDYMCKKYGFKDSKINDKMIEETYGG